MDGVVNRGGGIPAGAPLPGRALALRAARLRLVITDVDGVLTDGGVYYSERGESLKRFSLRDGMGVELLRDAGIETAFMTREDSAIVARRAEKLRVRHCYLGVADKRAALPRVQQEAGLQGGLEAGLDDGQIAYIGDDVNDLEIMAALALRGLVGAPVDAIAAARALAHHVTRRPGGQGAFRDFADWLLDLRQEARSPRESEITYEGEL
jgi:3-deoxy-D-manno-octulosonate 8-phosphate phosphatase (KDO 8-P phosphatase)